MRSRSSGRCRAGARSRLASGEGTAPVSNLVAEILLRLLKPLGAVVLGALVFIVAVGVGEPASVSLALLSWLSASAFILLVQESPL